MRLLGLHLRIQDSLLAVAEQAIRFNMPIFQCFLTDHADGKVISLYADEIEQFRTMRYQYFDYLYVHASYRTNLCRKDYRGFYTFRREVALAKRLGFTHIVIHPGSAKWCNDKMNGLKILVESLDDLLFEEDDITFVLENIAHGHYSVGGDIADFGYIIDNCRYPEKILFCIDTAHAFSYGYDIRTHDGQESFINLLEDKIGLEKIALLHINDTDKELGKHIDQHVRIGDGNISVDALKRFILHPKIRQIPALMELPVLTEPEQYEQYIMVKSWHDDVSFSNVEHEKYVYKI